MIGLFATPFNEEGRPTTFRDVNDYRVPVDRYGPVDGLESCEVTDLATKEVWVGHGKSGLSEMFFRRTKAAPSRNGLVVMAVVGMTSLHPSIEVNVASVFQYHRQVDAYEYEGRVGIDLKPEWGAPDMKDLTAGRSLMAFLRQPVWGFGDEPICLPSTMRLDFLKKFDDYRSLDLANDRTADDEARLQTILPEIMAAGMVIKDEGYRAYLSEMKARGLLVKASSPRTKVQCKHMEEVAAEIIAEIENRRGMAI